MAVEVPKRSKLRVPWPIYVLVVILAVVVLAAVLANRNQSVEAVPQGAEASSAPAITPSAPASSAPAAEPAAGEGPTEPPYFDEGGLSELITCKGDFTVPVKLWTVEAEGPQAILFLTRDKSAKMTCGQVLMMGPRSGEKQASIKLELCDGPCKGEGSGASAEATAVNTDVGDEVKVKGVNGVSYFVAVVPKKGKELVAFSDQPFFG